MFPWTRGVTAEAKKEDGLENYLEDKVQSCIRRERYNIESEFFKSIKKS
jgi:hypothetical protein